MSSDADLIKIVFSSGPAHLNREIIDRIAAVDPDLPLFVSAEFEPHRGAWIPYHVLRGLRENYAAIRAAIGNKKIRIAAMILPANRPLRKMRLIALALAPGALLVYGEDLQVVKGAGWGKHLLRRVIEAVESDRSRQWLRRLRHPAEAEIPIRARTAQLYGAIASRIRVSRPDVPITGHEPLEEGVTVVIPSRDGRELLETLLPSLLPQLCDGEVIVPGEIIVPGQVIVIDNGSSDGTADWLSREYPEVRLISAVRPLSFARAVNLGIVAARFTHTLLLNNDMVVKSGFLQALNAAFGSVPDLFSATAQIFFPPGIRRQETGKAVWRRENPLDFPVRCDDPIPGEDLTWVLYGSGGCSLFDTRKLRRLGGFSETFDPAYVEDLDLGYRAWKSGWSSVFCASAQVEHRHRSTTSRFYTPRELDWFVERNYLRFLIHALGSPVLFRRLWLEAIRRLQLMAMGGNGAALDTLRRIPKITHRPPPAAGTLSETEILAFGTGDVAVFPGRSAPGDKLVVVASPYVPFPLSHGGAVRIYNLMRNVDRDQILIAFCEDLTAPPSELLEICRHVILVRRHASHYAQSTARPDTVEEFDSKVFRACLKQVIRQWRPDIVQLEFTQMGQYAADCHPAKTILVEHDITFDLQQQLIATNAETGAARWELEQQLQKWRTFETAVWREVDCVVTMSARDQRMVSGAKQTFRLPNGVDTDRFQPSFHAPVTRRLLFIGSFAHLPNLLALEFFLREVWPLLGSSYTLHIIAGARHHYFLDFYRPRLNVGFGHNLNLPGIELEGFVPDVRNAYTRAELVIAPLTASAGTNIKVLEAMAMGRVVVSTPAGINGLDVSPGIDLIATASPVEMAEIILSLSSTPELRKNIERRARETALRFHWREIAERQSQLYDALSGVASSVSSST